MCLYYQTFLHMDFIESDAKGLLISNQTGRESIVIKTLKKILHPESDSQVVTKFCFHQTSVLFVEKVQSGFVKRVKM